MIKCWKKAIRKGAQNSPNTIKLIQDGIEKIKQEFPESHFLSLLEFFLVPNDSIKSNYAIKALSAIKKLPAEVKNKKYMLPILAYIISCGTSNHELMSEQIAPILI